MRRAYLTAFLLLVASISAVSADPVVLAKSGDAYVSRDEDANSWTIGSSSVAFTVSLASGTLQAVELGSPRLSAPLAIEPGPAAAILITGRSVSLGAADLNTVPP